MRTIATQTVTASPLSAAAAKTDLTGRGQSPAPKLSGIHHYMKSQAPPRGTPYWVMYFASCGIGFLGGVLSLAAGVSVAGRPGYPWWPIVLLAVLWAVMLLVAVAVGVIRFRGERRTAGAPPRV